MSKFLDGLEDRVVAAYRQHNLKATHTLFVPYDGDEVPACCALGALFFDDFKAEAQKGVDRRFVGVVRKATDASEMEVWAFIGAFDNSLLGTSYEDYNPWALAGKAVAERVKAEGLVAP